jgi:hypothetical protein
MRWKFWPKRKDGGNEYLLRYKDQWVKHNRHVIIGVSHTYNIPPLLLAAVCHIEVGGDHDSLDDFVYSVRAFDWNGPPFVDKHLTITNHPSKTSFGQVSIQLRTVAWDMGLDPNKLSDIQLSEIANCLKRDVFNIGAVARHIRNIIDHDKLSEPLSEESIRIIGGRYNGGMDDSGYIPLEKLKNKPKSMDYGYRIILRMRGEGYFRNFPNLVFGQ